LQPDSQRSLDPERPSVEQIRERWPVDALEPSQAIRVRGELRRQRLDGDVAIELRVARTPNLSHSAPANEREDFVMANTSTGSHSDQRYAPAPSVSNDDHGGPSPTRLHRGPRRGVRILYST
jgi:hypothetical protein